MSAGHSLASALPLQQQLQDSDSQFDKLNHQLSQLMDELANQNFFRMVSSDAWEPDVNIYEMSERYLVCAELSGMRPEEIDVAVEHGTLTIKGSRPRPCFPVDCEVSEAPSVHVMEINTGRFERRISISPDIDASRISATYHNGYLWLLMPKQG
jgi:HSP20 family protein